MNKLIKLAKMIYQINLQVEGDSILKLARISDKKYSEIGRFIIRYLIVEGTPDVIFGDLDPPQTSDSFSENPYQRFNITYNILRNIYKNVGLNISKEEDNYEKLSGGIRLEIYMPLRDEDCEEMLESGSGFDKQSLDSGLDRKWKLNIGGDCLKIYNYYRIRLFPHPQYFFGGTWDNSVLGKNWAKEVFMNDGPAYTYFIHEMTHVIDQTRSDSKINYKPVSLGASGLGIPATYINSKLEIQARLMQVFTDLREFLTIESPDLDAEKYLSSNKSKDPSGEKIIKALYENNFINFKNAVFEDPHCSSTLLLSEVKSENVIRRYTSRLFDIFNYLRNAFNLISGGGSSFKDISNINLKPTDE